jgi:hypothetical protein
VNQIIDVVAVPIFTVYVNKYIPPDVVLLEAVVSPPLHSGMVKPFYLFL